MAYFKAKNAPQSISAGAPPGPRWGNLHRARKPPVGDEGQAVHSPPQEPHVRSRPFAFSSCLSTGTGDCTVKYVEHLIERLAVTPIERVRSLTFYIRTLPFWCENAKMCSKTER